MNKKFVIISGGSKGIGAACVETFHKKSFTVYNLSRTQNKNLTDGNISIDLSEKLETSKINSLFSDIPNDSEIVLIHNAFPYYKDNSQIFDENQFNDSVQFVINNTISLNKSLIPKMGKGSAIIFIGSTLSEKAVPDCLSYVILKHAQVGLMKSLATELGTKNIHTCCICPGFTETEMLKSHSKDHEIESIINQIVLKKRLITPEEIADFVYQCSLMPITNGQVYHINLGQI